MLKQTIIDIVQDFISKNKSFSAYNVTTAIRNLGINCNHYAIRDKIHNCVEELLEQNNYEKVFVSPYFLYQPKTIKVNKYKKDARGRLCIPALFLRQVSMYKGDTVYIKPENNHIKILKNSSGCPYKVDKSNNVRISSSILNKAVLSIPSLNIEIDEKQNVIIIKN